ncbi:MAG: hypothetical protein ABR608_09145 [Pseudonocardiaceae bacterium]
MLDTELLGDPAACRETGEWMMRVATGTFDAATVLYEVRSRTHECWRGAAATAFEEHIGRGGREADQLSGEIERAGRALIVFSEELDTAAARLRQAREVAAAAALTVTSQGIEPPPTVILPAEPTTPQHVAAIDAYQAQVRAWDEVYQTVSYARGVELAAHERLAAATNVPRSMFDSLRSNAGFIATGAALGAAEGLYMQNTRFRELSARHARESMDFTRQIADKPNLTKAQRIRLQAARNAAGDLAVKANRIAHSQSRLLGGLNRTGSGAYLLQALAMSPTDKIQGTSLFAQGGKVLGKVPYVGVGVTLAQAGVDTYNGKPADQAFGSALISTGIGSGVTYAMLAYAPLAVAGGPFTLAAVGVGVVVSCGVGYVVDHHWDDIKDASGDTVEAVGDGVSTAARKLGGWLGG